MFRSLEDVQENLVEKDILRMVATKSGRVELHIKPEFLIQAWTAVGPINGWGTTEPPGGYDKYSK